MSVFSKLMDLSLQDLIRKVKTTYKSTNKQA